MTNYEIMTTPVQIEPTSSQLGISDCFEVAPSFETRLAFPCCVCTHRHGSDRDEPCIRCTNNLIAGSA